MASRRRKSTATRPPQDNQGGLVGWKAITQYAGLCVTALAKYRRFDGFPACALPDGRMYTSKNLIDQWIMARMVLEQEKAEKPGDRDSKA